MVGKWCSWAPRLTPARSLTSVVDVPAYPFSTSRSTVASSSRARIARVRSSCGTRVPAAWLATQSGWRVDNKQSSLTVCDQVFSEIVFLPLPTFPPASTTL